jgi:signal recognition particle subunit SRP54
MAERILGMGDVVSLVERAQDQFDEEQARESIKKSLKINLVLMTFSHKFSKSKKWVI